ncbi:hypothetical protein [Salinibacillus xinjiangensis]|uniref:Lipoprotein n=1 Tax=Salinibacillus xinjiangensis TaxID=1229268 RepID=A0A6G1X273_9BACI|nr:hypothetical protein [Salinibacillus xinjiangensis]MRG85034.1 hypothetical protein [Salinibacillus xinjiangensis]
MKLLYCIMLFVIMLLTGCGDQERAAEYKKDAGFIVKIESHGDKTVYKKVPNSDSRFESSGDTVQTLSAESIDKSNKLSTDFIKEHLSVDMTQAEVEGLIGQPDAKGVDAMNAIPTWRYDIVAKDGYKFEEQDSLLDSNVVDAVDINGLKKGDMTLQLFFSWKEERVSHFSGYYKEDGVVQEYRLFEDGTERVMTVSE